MAGIAMIGDGLKLMNKEEVREHWSYHVGESYLMVDADKEYLIYTDIPAAKEKIESLVHKVIAGPSWSDGYMYAIPKTLRSIEEKLQIEKGKGNE